MTYTKIKERITFHIRRLQIVFGLIVVAITPHAQAQNLFVVNAGSGTITEITPSGVKSQFSPQAMNSSALTFDSSGNIWTTFFNEVLPSNGNITVYPPDGSSGLNYLGINNPCGLIFDNTGDLFIAEQYPGAVDNSIYEQLPSSQLV